MTRILVGSNNKIYIKIKASHPLSCSGCAFVLCSSCEAKKYQLFGKTKYHKYCRCYDENGVNVIFKEIDKKGV